MLFSLKKIYHLFISLNAKNVPNNLFSNLLQNLKPEKVQNHRCQKLIGDAESNRQTEKKSRLGGLLQTEKLLKGSELTLNA